MSKPEDPAIKCLSDRSHWCRFEFDVVHHGYLHERVSRGIAEVDYGSELAASAGSYWLPSIGSGLGLHTFFSCAYLHDNIQNNTNNVQSH